MQKHLEPYIQEGYIFDDQRFNYLKSWVYLLMQLHDAKLSLDLAEKSENYENKGTINEVIMQQSFFRNSIINYAKCFSSSGKGRTSLDKNKVYKAEPELLATHEEIMNIRNKFSAHNDGSGIDDANIAVKEDNKKILIKPLYTVSNPLGEYEKYRKTFEYCESHITTSINHALDRIQESTGKFVLFNS